MVINYIILILLGGFMYRNKKWSWYHFRKSSSRFRANGKKTITLEDGSTKNCFVIYALGNFICDQNAENTRNSIILNLTITKQKTGKISIDKVDYIPIYMYKDSSLKTKKKKLLYIYKTISNYDSGIDTSIGKNTYLYLQKQLKILKIFWEKNKLKKYKNSLFTIFILF